MTPAEQIAAAVFDTCDVTIVHPHRPTRLEGRTGFIQPSEVWLSRDESSFCDVSVGLDVYLVAGTTDVIAGTGWLAEQSALVIGVDSVTVGGDATQASEVSAPFLFAEDQGGKFLAVKVTFDRFTP